MSLEHPVSHHGSELGTPGALGMFRANRWVALGGALPCLPGVQRGPVSAALGYLQTRNKSHDRIQKLNEPDIGTASAFAC